MAVGPLIGLDIGSQQIKIAELKPGKTGLAITALGVGPTPAGVIQNNIITDPAIMGIAIKQLMRESGISVKRVVGCISGQNAVVIRIIEVPRMTDAELKETMKWEVERHVPFAPSETMLDYQPLVQRTPEALSNPNMEVLLAVAQQDAVNNYLNALFAAGLDPIAIDIEPLATARAILDIAEGQPVIRPQFLPGQDMALEGPLPETIAIVNIGAANTDISIFQGDQLTFPRSLPLAGDSLTRAIAEALQYTPEQAERVKREYAIVQLDRMAVYTGTRYEGDTAYDGVPQFEDEGGFGLNEDEQNHAFDLQGGDEAGFEDGGFRATPSGRLGETTFDDTERTQPMSRRTLNLAKPLQSDSPLPFMPPPDDGFGLPPLDGAVDADKLRDDIFEAIAPVLGELASELRRSLDYYRSRGAQISVDRVLLTGGTANLINLAAFLQNELQIPVVVANSLASLPVTSRQFDPSYLPVIGPTFTVAVGLALREAVFSANPAPKPPKAPRKAAAAGAAAS